MANNLSSLERYLNDIRAVLAMNQGYNTQGMQGDRAVFDRGKKMSRIFPGAYQLPEPLAKMGIETPVRSTTTRNSQGDLQMFRRLNNQALPIEIPQGVIQPDVPVLLTQTKFGAPTPERIGIANFTGAAPLDPNVFTDPELMRQYGIAEGAIDPAALAYGNQTLLGNANPQFIEAKAGWDKKRINQIKDSGKVIQGLGGNAWLANYHPLSELYDFNALPPEYQKQILALINDPLRNPNASSRFERYNLYDENLLASDPNSSLEQYPMSGYELPPDLYNSTDLKTFNRMLNKAESKYHPLIEDAIANQKLTPMTAEEIAEYEAAGKVVASEGFTSARQFFANNPRILERVKQNIQGGSVNHQRNKLARFVHENGLDNTFLVGWTPVVDEKGHPVRDKRGEIVWAIQPMSQERAASRLLSSSSPNLPNRTDAQAGADTLTNSLMLGVYSPKGKAVVDPETGVTVVAPSHVQPKFPVMQAAEQERFSGKELSEAAKRTVAHKDRARTQNLLKTSEKLQGVLNNALLQDLGSVKTTSVDKDLIGINKGIKGNLRDTPGDLVRGRMAAQEAQGDVEYRTIPPGGYTPDDRQTWIDTAQRDDLYHHLFKAENTGQINPALDDYRAELGEFPPQAKDITQIFYDPKGYPADVKVHSPYITTDLAAPDLLSTTPQWTAATHHQSQLKGNARPVEVTRQGWIGGYPLATPSNLNPNRHATSPWAQGDGPFAAMEPNERILPGAEQAMETQRQKDLLATHLKVSDPWQGEVGGEIALEPTLPNPWEGEPSHLSKLANRLPVPAVAPGKTSPNLWQANPEYIDAGVQLSKLQKEYRELKSNPAKFLDAIEEGRADLSRLAEIEPEYESAIDHFSDRIKTLKAEGKTYSPFEIPNEQSLLENKLVDAHIKLGNDYYPLTPSATVNVAGKEIPNTYRPEEWGEPDILNAIAQREEVLRQVKASIPQRQALDPIPFQGSQAPPTYGYNRRTGQPFIEPTGFPSTPSPVTIEGGFVQRLTPEEYNRALSQEAKAKALSQEIEQAKKDYDAAIRLQELNEGEVTVTPIDEEIRRAANTPISREQYSYALPPNSNENIGAQLRAEERQNRLYRTLARTSDDLGLYQLLTKGSSDTNKAIRASFENYVPKAVPPKPGYEIGKPLVSNQPPRIQVAADRDFAVSPIETTMGMLPHLEQSPEYIADTPAAARVIAEPTAVPTQVTPAAKTFIVDETKTAPKSRWQFSLLPTAEAQSRLNNLGSVMSGVANRVTRSPYRQWGSPDVVPIYNESHLTPNLETTETIETLPVWGDNVGNQLTPEPQSFYFPYSQDREDYEVSSKSPVTPASNDDLIWDRPLSPSYYFEGQTSRPQVTSTVENNIPTPQEQVEQINRSIPNPPKTLFGKIPINKWTIGAAGLGAVALGNMARMVHRQQQEEEYQRQMYERMRQNG